MAPKNPTNHDLSKQIGNLTKELNEMNITLLRHDNSINLINKRQELTDNANAAVAAYKAQEEKDRHDKLSDKELTNRNAVWVKLGIVLGLVIAILAAYAAGKRIR